MAEGGPDTPPPLLYIMKFTPFKPLCTLALGILVLSMTSCLGPQISPELAAKIEVAEAELEEARMLEEPPHLPGSYEHFVTHHNYPTTMKIFRDDALMAQANGRSPIYICLEQQRGRLYVNGQVAADWPVSTGVSSRPTPTGTYRVLEKKPDYASNLYGKIKDANGKTVIYNADATKDAIPEGGRFDGSPMPYWQRLTWDGLGMHVGKVKAGKRLSHGCIRTPREMAKSLYNVTSFRTKVHIVDVLEPCYPARDALVNGETYKESVRRRENAESNLIKLLQEADKEMEAKLKAEGKEMTVSPSAQMHPELIGKKPLDDNDKPVIIKKVDHAPVPSPSSQVQPELPQKKAAPSTQQQPDLSKPTSVQLQPEFAKKTVPAARKRPASNIGVVHPVMPQGNGGRSYIHMPLPR